MLEKGSQDVDGCHASTDLARSDLTSKLCKFKNENERPFDSRRTAKALPGDKDDLLALPAKQSFQLKPEDDKLASGFKDRFLTRETTPPFRPDRSPKIWKDGARR